MLRKMTNPFPDAWSLKSKEPGLFVNFHRYLFGFSLNQIYLCIAAFLPSTGIFLGSVTALVGTMISIIAMEVLFIRN